jgi:hypothetical protein
LTFTLAPPGLIRANGAGNGAVFVLPIDLMVSARRPRPRRQ